MFFVFRVADYEAKNKMGVANLVSLFGPTMMTVDGDPVSVDLTSWLPLTAELFDFIRNMSFYPLFLADNLCQHPV